MDRHFVTGPLGYMFHVDYSTLFLNEVFCHQDYIFNVETPLYL